MVLVLVLFQGSGWRGGVASLLVKRVYVRGGTHSVMLIDRSHLFVSCNSWVSLKIAAQLILFSSVESREAGDRRHRAEPPLPHYGTR